MSKSKYPRELDSSVELPIVRDNILEVGADALNGLRSAVINIERTLGVNPHGAVGNTVSERLSRITDGNGNLLSEALSSVNVLTGPVTDSEVSRVAGIQESKLKLNFPTSLLQSEISILNNEVAILVEQMEAVSALISAHLHPSATGRHKASAISVELSSLSDSEISTSEIESIDVQSVIEDIYSKHINLVASSISATNNSHESEQIYFDSSNISTVTDASDVQQAIEDLANSNLDGQSKHQDNMHSNGILKIGKRTAADSLTHGPILFSDISITFGESTGQSSNTTTINFTDPVVVGDIVVKTSDILTISDASDVDDIVNGDYQIAEVVYDGLGLEIVSLKIYGLLNRSSSGQSIGTITQNIYQDISKFGLIFTTRQSAGLTSANVIQVANPDAVGVITQGIKPSEITNSNRYIDIEIDGTTVNIDLYDSTVANQTIDSIVGAVNEQCAENKHNFLAYRVTSNDRQEMAIVHNLPDTEEETHTLKIITSTDGGIDSVGYSHVDGVEITSSIGSSYYINGIKLSGLTKKLDSSSLVYFVGANLISIGSSDLDFLDLHIKKDDVLIISDSDTEADNGSYIVTNVTSTTITVDLNQIPLGFSASSSENTRFRIYECTASFDDVTFDEVAEAFAAILVDVFMDVNGNIFNKKLIEYSAPTYASESLFTVVDFIGDISNSELEVTISNRTDHCIFSIDGGDEVTVYGNNSYVWVKSGLNNNWIKFYIPDAELVINKIILDAADLTVTLYGFEGGNYDSNLLLSRVAYHNFNGRIGGGLDSPRIFRKLSEGNVSINDISNSAIYSLREEPLSELRSSGIIIGLEVTSVTIEDDFYKISISPGIAYVLGKRFEIPAYNDFITDINSVSIDKFFIAIDEDGDISCQQALPDCVSPFSDSDFALLAVSEYNSVTIVTTDLRLFVDKLDYKLLNSITVSPQSGMAHFSSVNKAISYARHFSHIFPNAGTPTIHLKSGTHTVNIEFDYSSVLYSDFAADLLSDPEATLTDIHDEFIRSGIFIDFPVNIIGEGDTTILSARNTFVFSDVTHVARGQIVIPGSAFNSASLPFSTISTGFVNIENIKFNNTKIEIIDASIAGELKFGIKIDNCIFDFSSFTASAMDSDPGRAVSLVEVSDTSTNKGNLSVNRCTFIESYISFSALARLKNLIFGDNILFGDDAAYLFDKNILTIATASSASNIEIYGNYNAENFVAEGTAGSPNMVLGSTDGWGTRLNRDLHVGGDLNVAKTGAFGDDVTVDGTVTADSFEYSDTYYRYKSIHMSQNMSTTLGGSGLSATVATISVDGFSMPAINFDSTLVFADIRLEVLAGETLDTVTIAASLEGGLGTADPFSMTIYSHDTLFSNVTTEHTDASVTAAYAGGTIYAATLSSLGLVGGNNTHYWVRIYRAADSTGNSQYVHLLQYRTIVPDVQAIGGLT